MMQKFRLLILTLVLTGLSGCASVPGVQQSLAELADRLDAPAELATHPSAMAAPEPADEIDPVAERPMLFPGSDVAIRVPRPRVPVTMHGEAVSLRFEEAPVADVVHAILGDLLQADYSIVSPISGEITLHTHQPVPKAHMLGVLESLLQANGIVMVPDINGRYQVGSPDVVRTAIPLTAMVGDLPVGVSTVVVPLRFIGATEMAEILGPVTAAENILRVDTTRNLLLLGGTRTQIEGWVDLIATFDVDFLKGLSIGLFPLQYAPVREVEVALRTVFAGAGGLGGAVSGGFSAIGSGEASGAAASEGAGPLAGLVRVLPIERLNAILVVTPRAHYLEQARLWVERFDRPLESGSEPQLFVYPVQNGSAQHIAGLLNGLYGGGGGESDAARPVDSGVAPALGRTEIGQVGAGSGLPSQPTGGAASIGGLMGQSQGATGGETTHMQFGRVRVIADDHNNALLIYAPRRDYRIIESALRQLDVAPTQVLIEATIVEVTLNDELRYGLQWFFQGGLGEGRTGVGRLTSTESGALAAASPGFSYSIINSAGAIRAVLNALAQQNLLNVISTPSVMVQDNHTAAIHVGDQQPVRTSETVTDGGNTTTSIQYKDTGVMLAVSPSVNAGGMVTMTVEQSVTDVGQVDLATGQRSFLQRQLSSRVAVRSGETVVLGGLIRDNSNRVRQGLPLLHDLPVVGNLFGSTSINTDRTELLVLITPRVLRNEQDLREVNAELRQRMRGIRDLTARSRPADQSVKPE